MDICVSMTVQEDTETLLLVFSSVWNSIIILVHVGFLGFATT